MNETLALTDAKKAIEGSIQKIHQDEPSQIDWKTIYKPLSLILGGFLIFFFLPMDSTRFTHSMIASLALVKWYAREHVLLCLVPAFFIAGAVAVFVSQAAVIKYLGAEANKLLSYGVASVSGSVLAVCSCTVLPLFAGIWKQGAGLGLAVAFLYSGPAINVLAIILTARILGPEIGAARAVGAIVFSVVIGLVMHLMFRKEEQAKTATIHMPAPEVDRPLWQTSLLFAVMVGLLVSATWGRPEQERGFWSAVCAVKWWLAGGFAAGLGFMMVRWMRVKLYKLIIAAIVVLVLSMTSPQQPLIAFSAGLIALVMLMTTTRGETETWFVASWDFAKQIIPLLLAGVLVAGLLLGQPGSEGLIPSQWISGLVGGNSLWANLFASMVGAFMYFATLTEVPILEGLINAGMGKGPALALLLAGPALSLPNMLVIRSVMGTQKTIAFVVLVVMVALNSLTMLLLYGVLGGFLLGVGRLPVPWQALLLSIGIYVALPLMAGYFSRRWLISAKGKRWFDEKFLHVLTPITIIALLITLMLLFSYKGEVIVGNPLTILWIAVPLFIQTMLIFCLGYGLARLLKLRYADAAPAAMIGASNHFEVAIATSTMLFGLSSGAALATVVGVLIEVPVMLMLVKICLATQSRFATE